MPIPSEVVAVKRPLLREEIYEQVQRWILSGSLLPGEQLRDTDLSARLGVSRTPVREALRMLADEGLVEMASGRWTRVSSITLRDARELYPAIQALEIHLIEDVIAHLTSDHHATMAATNLTLENALRQGSAGLAAQADNTFHQVLRQASDNATVTGLLEGLGRKAGRLLTYLPLGVSEMQSILDEHTLILEALNTGKVAEAQKGVATHWHKSLLRLEAQWSPHE